jgi:hypothetical protein
MPLLVLLLIHLHTYSQYEQKQSLWWSGFVHFRDPSPFPLLRGQPSSQDDPCLIYELPAGTCLQSEQNKKLNIICIKFPLRWSVRMQHWHWARLHEAVRSQVASRRCCWHRRHMHRFSADLLLALLLEASPDEVWVDGFKTSVHFLLLHKQAQRAGLRPTACW